MKKKFVMMAKSICISAFFMPNLLANAPLSDKSLVRFSYYSMTIKPASQVSSLELASMIGKLQSAIKSPTFIQYAECEMEIGNIVVHDRFDIVSIGFVVSCQIAKENLKFINIASEFYGMPSKIKQLTDIDTSLIANSHLPLVIGSNGEEQSIEASVE